MAEQDYFPRVQEIILPLLRAGLPDNVHVSSWIPDIDYREYPIVNVRRLGGYRGRDLPSQLDKPVVEITAYHTDGIEATEELYARVLDVLFEATRKQTVVDRGYISFMRETLGMTQFSSLFQDTWRIQGLIQIGIRPVRKDSDV
ncbi:hypothetical protein QP927_08645 [Corynebacterium pseudodiphtheriticum]|uniref:hypothetical protein n=1 Tax=Corynebacterium pseudodiphtheriticum TaxID=37637 RepID=UPI0020BD4C34|nr:hypothetical protein [Corynebacterium pseudodiphtheriticum]MDK8478932.1 hypothetical protein [Corynebacterium pseudodiphtheriticum]UQV56384.1 hypothetical protein L9H27_01035 [Corynebacterium pseudodiphtheriticum]